MTDGTYYALTQYDYVHQKPKHFQSITLGCEKVNVMNMHMSVVSHCVVSYTNQLFGPKSGNDRAFFHTRQWQHPARVQPHGQATPNSHGDAP